MSQHWNQFTAAVPWFPPKGVTAEAGPDSPPGAWSPASSDFVRLFPRLTALLRSAARTSVNIGADPYDLYSWRFPDGVERAWLVPRSSPGPADRLFPDHRTLLQSFGGIVERSNDVEDSWLLNQGEVLTAQTAERDAAFLNDYAWAFEEAGGGIPIDVGDYYAVSNEANGNCTLCSRSTGSIVLFAPDHAFSHVRPLPGCPEYTLYSLEGALAFADWVETIAGQWLARLRSRTGT
jgi:hypothetical protein